ncbi:helix-turn-helix domain-containing protein [Streptomyces sp. 4N509B]|uniref:helix-turn-helix domain-containing protein n=1 Tax=Streptomyces sp. 4N509B TaxID=3457413 RepID=UPI003FD0F901
MGLRARPTQRQRRLGAELRKLRESAGLSASEAGTRIGLGRAYMSHIETGRAGISEERLRILVESYGVTRADLIDNLVELALLRGSGWWTQYADTADDSARDLAELEAAAVSYRSFQWVYVPGLLQTSAYTRALFESGEPGVPAARIERSIEFRGRRQQVLHRDPPPRFHALIHEATFHMHFVPREVMLGQLEYLVELSGLPHVTIQLLPFRAPSYPATSTSPFVIFDERSPELRTLYFEHPVTSSFIGDPSQIAQFSAAFDRLSKVALSPLKPGEDDSRSSMRLLQHLRYVLEEMPHVGP